MVRTILAFDSTCTREIKATRPYEFKCNQIRIRMFPICWSISLNSTNAISISDSYVMQTTLVIYEFRVSTLKLKLPVLIKGFKAFRIQFLDQITSINLTILKPQINQFNQ